MKVLIVFAFSCLAIVALSSGHEDIKVIAFKHAIEQLVIKNQITCKTVDRFCDADATAHPYSVEAACRDTLKGFLCGGKTRGDGLRELYKQHVELLQANGEESFAYE